MNIIPKKMLDRIASLGIGELRELDEWLHGLIAEKEADMDRFLTTRNSENRRVSYQHEYVCCGKPGCKCANGQKHGPYWYAYWSDDFGKTHKQYIGKNLPVKDSSID